MSRYNQQFSSLIQKIGTRTIINALPDEWKGKRLLLIHDNCEPHLTDEVRDEAAKNNISLFNLPPHHICCTATWCFNQQAVKRSAESGIQQVFGGHSFDLITKDLLIEWIVASWNGIDSDTILSSFSVCGYGVEPQSEQSKNIFYTLQTKLVSPKSSPRWNRTTVNGFKVRYHTTRP